MLELIVRPSGFRDAAAFRGLTGGPEPAFRVPALVGGTPAHLEMCGGSGPADLDGFDRRTDIPCRAHRKGHELDVVVTETDSLLTDDVTEVVRARADVDLSSTWAAGIPASDCRAEKPERLPGKLPVR